MTRVLVTCPPMIGVLADLAEDFNRLGWDVEAPPVRQTLTQDELVRYLPEVDGWIAGDDPVNKATLGAGVAGRLRGVVKWGVGVDNVDFAAAETLGLQVRNTPGMFGEEVADLALGYVIALARHTFQVDRRVRQGGWPKPRGTSLRGKALTLAGFGSIGKAAAQRFAAVGLRVSVHDPHYVPLPGLEVVRVGWPNGVRDADFIVLTCPLTPETHHMLNEDALRQTKAGVRIVNVARGPLIDEAALAAALDSGQVAGAALDVFEEEPLPMGSPLRAFDSCILGSHNASNTHEAALRASRAAIEHLRGMLEGER